MYTVYMKIQWEQLQRTGYNSLKTYIYIFYVQQIPENVTV